MKSATKKRNELLSLQSGGDHLSPQDHNSLECRSSGLSWPSDGESKQKSLLTQGGVCLPRCPLSKAVKSA